MILSARSSGPSQSGMAGRGALVDAGGEAAHLRDLVGDLLPHQVSAEPHLAALADEELARVREHQVVGVEPVARLDALVEPLGRIAPLVRDHASLARARRRPRHRRTAGEGGLRLVGQRAEAHAGDVDRDVELEGDLRARADDRLRVALLAVALDHEAGQRPRKEGEVVPVRDRLEHGEAAHPVSPELGLDVDVVDHLPGEDPAPPENARVALRPGGRIEPRRGLALRHLVVSRIPVIPRVPERCARSGQRISFFSVGSRLS